MTAEDTATWANTFVEATRRGLEEAAVPADLGPMRAYMRNQFPFLGVRSPAQKQVFRAALAAAGALTDEADAVAAIDALWTRPHREYRYVGAHLACRVARWVSPEFVDHVGRWITTDPWWDTCDPLSRNCVGQIARRHPEVRVTMDRWLHSDDLWLCRGAILHMGGWKSEIDREWVFAACQAQAGHTDFFIRKAIGWILRDLAWVDPDAVRAFVDGPGRDVLSPLSKREACKHLKP